MKTTQTLILGSGPAGLTAALYAARANLKPIVLEGKLPVGGELAKIQPGGQLMWTTVIENFPGFPKGIDGYQLMDNMRQQATGFGARTFFETASRVDLARRPFTVETDEDVYQGETLIIATGASARTLNLPSEAAYMGYGVSTCATCDGWQYRNKRIAVIGGGDAAMEEGSFLTRYTDDLTIIHRRHELRASKVMQERVFQNPKIKFLWDREVMEVLGEDNPKHVTGLRLKNRVSGEIGVLPIDAMFLAIGHDPNVALFRGQLETNRAGYLITRAALATERMDEGHQLELLRTMPPHATATTVDGVFACGDVQDHHYRQAITAAGSGCQAAMDAEDWLEAHVGIPEAGMRLAAS